jgi:Ni/Co efflux regulator RcnB
MKRLLQTASLATLLLSSATVLADPPHKHGNDKHGNGHGYYDSKHGGKHLGKHDNGRHYGQIKQAYRRGDYVPVVYMEPRYYVEDYRQYRLAAPPRGYRWVRPVDDRYLLVEVATGLISQALGY